MKKAPRRPFKPWFKKRQTTGRFVKAALDESEIDPKELESKEFFVGFQKIEDSLIDNSDEDEEDVIRLIQFQVEEGCPFMAWNLYFPRLAFTESEDVVKIINAMIAHFQRYPHWYEIEKIVENSTLELRMENIALDDVLEADWPCWYQDFLHRPDDVVNAIGLAVHTLLIADVKNNHMKKIHVRPNSFKPMTHLNDIPTDNVGDLIATRASIIHAGETEYITDMICFRCNLCSALIAVKQSKKEEDEKYLEPKKCVGSCKGGKEMEPLYDSPFTSSYSRQVVTVQTISHNFSQSNRTVEVVIYRDLTDAFSVGQEVVIIGMIKQAVEDYDEDENIKFKNPFMKKKDKASNPIIIRTYIKCFTMLDCFNEEEAMAQDSLGKDNSPELELVTKLRADPNIFKVLLHSLCPQIAGREVAKAFTLLGLFGGHGLMGKFRRSAIHVLLLGSTGTGKSVILQSAYEVAPKGMAVSAANITLAGLTASCDESEKANAGAIALCDNGILYIDELDKMEREQQQAMIACMDSEVISIHKNGSFLKLQARTNILAAANPSAEVYDYNEPIIANMSFPIDLLEKFDIVVPFLPNTEEDVEAFLHNIEKKLLQKQEDLSMSLPNSTQDLENDFFDTPMVDATNKNSHWMKKELDENLTKLSKKDMQTYIKYALEGCRPKLSKQAAKLLKFFYENYTAEQPHRYDEVWTTAHNIESLTRLTLARARIDFADKATVEHAKQVLSLFKAAQIDVYPHHDISVNGADSSTMMGLKTQVDISTLSKPKQMKAFLELLVSKSEEKKTNVFTTAKIMEMAIDLGLKDYYEIIMRLNYDGFILKTSEGYKLVNKSM